MGIRSLSSENIDGSVVISNNEFYKAESTSGTDYKIAGLTSGNMIQIGAIDYTSAGTIFAGGDNISITTGGASGTTRIKIDSSGNVGIGTSSPNHKLDIYSNENIPLRIHRPSNSNLDSAGAHGIGFSTRSDAITSTTDTRSGIFSYYNGNLFFATNTSSIASDPDGSARMTIINTGYVGIGTMTPSVLLELQDSTHTTMKIKSGNSDNIFFAQAIQSDEARIGTDTNTAISFFTNTSRRMTITTSGNVGIGTVTPDEKLVVGTTGGTQNIEISNSYIQSFNRSGSPGYASLNFYASSYAFNVGNVGIGTTSPAQPLSVHGNFLVRTTNADGNKNRMQCVVGGSSDAANLYLYYGNTGDGTVSVRLNAQGDSYLNGGDVGIGTTNPAALLDISSGTTTDVIRFGANSRWGFSRANSDNRYLSFMRNQNGSGTAVWTADGDNGYVGIGTTLPAAPLVVKAAQGGMFRIEDSAGNIGAYTEFSGGYSYQYYYQIGGSVKIALQTNGPSYFNGGNVGISNTTPTHKLHIGSNSTSATIDIGLQNDARHYNIKTSNGNLIIRDESAGADRILLNSSGNVGIGTNNPTSYNSNADNLVIYEANDFTGITLASDNDQGSNIYFADGDDDNAGGITYNHTSDFMNFRVNGAERIRISSSGSVGINRNDPSVAKLSVMGGGTSIGTQDIVAIIASTSQRPIIQFSESTAQSISAGMSIEYNGVGSGDNNFIAINDITGAPKVAMFSGGNVGIGTTVPTARLNSYGAIISQSADNDPEVTLTNTGSWGVQAGGTIRVMQGFSRSGVSGDEIIFTYAATSWKSWSLDYTFTSTSGLTQGTIGGYWNNSGGQNNVENIDNHQTSVAVTHGGSGNQNNIITFTFNNPGTHINCSFVYTQSGGDGAPRGDRVTIETISNTP